MNEMPPGGDYAQDVVAALLPYFADLKVPFMAKVVENALRRYVEKPYPMFEVLLDERGNWRLYAKLGTPGEVRLACCKIVATEADEEGERRINALLAKIS